MPFEAAVGRNTLQGTPPRPDLEIEVTLFRPDATTAAVLSFLDPLVEGPSRP